MPPDESCPPWEGIVVASEPATSRRMEAARRANRHLAHLAERLHPDWRDEHLVGFLCECGCMATAALAVAEFDACDGAWCAGHKPI